MRKLIILLIISFVILSGCGKTKIEQKSVCELHQFEFKKGECCLDENSNKVCDEDETKEETPVEETTQKEQIKEQVKEKTSQQVIEDAMKKVVKLEVKDVNASVNVESIGSGFIVDPEGYILTNLHVIWPNEYLPEDEGIKVIDHDGKEYSVKIIGFNYQHDLALLKTRENNTFEYFTFGNSEVLNIGDKIFVLGHPANLNFSVASGVISAKKRPSYINEEIKAYIQTDAAVNTGNSGGPMINERGEVVGMNTFGEENEWEGLNFALESNTMKELYENMKSTLKYRKLETEGFYQTQPNRAVDVYFEPYKFVINTIAVGEYINEDKFQERSRTVVKSIDVSLKNSGGVIQAETEETHIDTSNLCVNKETCCEESDDGQDFNTKGITVYKRNGKVVSENVDTCIDESTIFEYFCDTSGEPASITEACNCYDGHCAEGNEFQEAKEVEICIDLKIIKEGIKKAEERIDKFTLQPNQKIIKTYNPNVDTMGVLNAYYEIKTSNCATNEIYNVATVKWV